MLQQARIRMLLPLFLVALTAPALGAPGTKPKILKTAKVAGSVHMIDGVDPNAFVGGNVTVLDGPDGLLLVDTLLPELDSGAPLGPELLGTLSGLSKRPVKFVINSHAHIDHIGCNGAFNSREVTFLAHASVAAQLETGRPEGSLPFVVIQDKKKMRHNGVDIEITHYPAAHSSGDLVVHFKQAKVVAMGDLYFAGMFPMIGEGGSMDGLISCIEKVLAEIPADARIIPGHGPLATPKDLKATLVMLQETRAIVKAGLAKGQTLEQMTRDRVLAKYDAWGGGYMTTDRYLEQLHALLST